MVVGQGLWTAFGCVLFAILGSHLSAAIYRLPRGGGALVRGTEWSLWWGRSRCPHCGAVLGWLDLIPLLSWLALRGRCRHCGHSIGVLYPAMEAASIASFLVAGLLTGSAGDQLEYGLLGAMLVALALTDVQYLLLPDLLIAPLAALPVILDLLGREAPQPLPDALLGALFAGGFLWLVRLAYLKLRHLEALGLGDVKLFAVAGLWIGPAAVAPALLIACVGTLAAVAVRRLCTGQGATGYIPFGPGLALGFYVMSLVVYRGGW